MKLTRLHAGGRLGSGSTAANCARRAIAGQPLVYAIGLDPLVARAIYADLPQARFQKRKPLGLSGARGRRGPGPDLVLIGLRVADVETELSAARAAWGTHAPIVGVGGAAPFARVWKQQDLAEIVEIGPGFLLSLLGGPSA